MLFIHGYNTMFAEGLYRFAQVMHDSQAPAVPVLGLQLRILTGVSLYGWQQARPDEARADIAEGIRRWQSGELRPTVHATYPLTEVARIHETLDARANLGRLIAIP